MIRFFHCGSPSLRTPLTSLALCLLLNSCSDYEVKFNDRPIYTPQPLFSDYRLSDPALKNCVRQTIKDKEITTVTGLTILACTHAGIASLGGLDRFAALEQLNLAHNAISMVDVVAQLPRLKRVDLSNNALVEVAALMTLADLEELDLRENPALDCFQALQIRDNSKARVALPKHCIEAAETNEL